MTFDDDSDGFTRLHRAFTFHLGIAVSLAWMTSLYAAAYAPWVRNIRPLIDPLNVGRPESTWSFLFALPIVLTIAWLITVYGHNLLRDMRVLKNQFVEFGIAGVIAFALFYMSIDRAVAALLLGV
jgi:hypothetical protein